MVVDTHLFTGAYGVVTSVEVPLTLKEINKLKMYPPFSTWVNRGQYCYMISHNSLGYLCNPLPRILFSFDPLNAR